MTNKNTSNKKESVKEGAATDFGNPQNPEENDDDTTQYGTLESVEILNKKTEDLDYKLLALEERFESKIESFEKESNKYKELEKKIPELENKFESKIDSFKKESIGMIGIFSAIVAFLIVSTQLFTGLELYNAIIILTGLASIILIFVSVIVKYSYEGVEMTFIDRVIKGSVIYIIILVIIVFTLEMVPDFILRISG